MDRTESFSAFDLPGNLQKLLKKFAADNNPEMRAITAHALAWKFKEIPPFGNLLKNLAEDRDEGVRKVVAYAIVKNFWNLSDDIQKILVNLVILVPRRIHSTRKMLHTVTKPLKHQS